jgi:hypothetical protein
MCAHLDRLIVLAPKNPRPYRDLFEVFSFIDDAKRLEDLKTRLESADLDLKESNRRDLEILDDKKNVKRLEELGRAILILEQKVKQARALGGKSLAAALDNLVAMRLAEMTLTNKGDIEELLRLAREGHAAAPSDGTRSILLGVYLTRAHLDLEGKHAGYGELSKKHGRVLGPANLLALALDKEDLRKDMHTHPDLKKAAALLAERTAAFPKQAYPAGWALLRHVDPVAAEKLAAATKADPSAATRRAIMARLSPMNISDAYSDYWQHSLEGRPREGRARLEALVKHGLPVLLP